MLAVFPTLRGFTVKQRKRLQDSWKEQAPPPSSERKGGVVILTLTRSRRVVVYTCIPEKGGLSVKSERPRDHDGLHRPTVIWAAHIGLGRQSNGTLATGKRQIPNVFWMVATRPSNFGEDATRRKNHKGSKKAKVAGWIASIESSFSHHPTQTNFYCCFEK